MLSSSLVLLVSNETLAQEAKQGESTAAIPYVVDIPVSQNWCPPIRSTFYEAERDFTMIRGRRFNHKPNGGYGLAVIDKIGDKNLLHTGADLGWHQVGEPVFAVADGIVRRSSGPSLEKDSDDPLEHYHRTWGNVIVIEHRVSEDEYVTVIYGHLGTERFIEAGDIVTSGQQIGTIGRRHKRVNGNYIPHLHIGVQKSRLYKEDAELMELSINDEQCKIKMGSLSEGKVELVLSETELPLSYLILNGKRFELENRDGRIFAPATLFWTIPTRPGFTLSGYELTTDGFWDPVAFLRERINDTGLAPYQLHDGR